MLSVDDAKKIRLVIFDVDGVMTDGSIYITEEGEAFKKFNVKDGLAIELLRTYGIMTGVISGKSSAALDTRCKSLGFDFIQMGTANKLPVVNSLCKAYKLEYSQIAFCGDDILDIPVMELVSISAAPLDAHPLVLEMANWISTKSGGCGMVRQFVDELIKARTSLTLKEIYAPLMESIRNSSGSLEQ
ncbi:TPA: KdsC family phosphatase [Vibrio cholerae]|uniref:KdsC family phosphatase n=1 Tax=Vibrio cholerae TaxID=666 RepID=UPI0002DC237B|nr:HAD-IIIA family hydrolase [Vibrio cholerae]EHU0375944.1 HAD-IIIA family hydrolase [Vibrio cholerae]EJL6946068.1 HAD-IIIA family hydrolase [Vibrio cholerae]EKF9749547.1 HAD-IIIA family hydrolase [Vibrio cholerae]KNH52377.1 3-deoxy-D-manno-octulosonate 8-phosphate phosphatase [Vibrio cholerae 623-39]MDV2340272.1 HAD-IIIA family hydrolase [Vibrio cholerae]